MMCLAGMAGSFAETPSVKTYRFCQLPLGGSKPSQALPRQLSRRESQAIKFIAKGLGVMRKFLAVLLALPLGELAKP